MKPPTRLALTFSFLTLAVVSPSQFFSASGAGGDPKSAQAAQAGAGAKSTPNTQSSQDRNRSLIHGKPGSEPLTTANDFGAKAGAVVIGISSYKNLPSQNQLQFASEDARAMRDFLVGAKGGFKRDNVKLLTNETATHEAISRAVDDLLTGLGNRDLAFIFFAGHGIVNKSNQGFLLAYDSNPDDLLMTAIEMGRFNSFLTTVRTRSVIIFTDACHSGAIGDLLNQQGSGLSSVTAQSFVEPGSREDQSSFILSAASPKQSSWEIETLKHGLFTYHVLNGMDGAADLDGNGLVTASELYDYVSTQVRREAEKLGHSQIPEFNARFDRSIPLAYLTEAGQKLYQNWFESDPFTSRNSAFFDEALKSDKLTRPERESAWDYYNALKAKLSTPPDVLKQKGDELLTKLGSSGQAVIERATSDPLKWTEAGEWFEKAYQLSRNEGFRVRQAYCTAMSAHYSNENGKAERDCDIALSIIGENHLSEPMMCLRIGQFFRKLAKWDKARAPYKLAIESDSKVDWIAEYADVLVRLGDLAEADKQLRRGREIDANYVPGLKLLASVLLQSGQKEKVLEAVEIARHARQLKPDDIEILEVYGSALLESGNAQQALDPLRKVAMLRLPDAQTRDAALLRLARAYGSTGDLDRSLSALREAETLGCKQPEVFDKLARVLEERGELRAAVAAAKTAAGLTQPDGLPKAGRVRTVAEYLERMGQLEEAALKFKDAARFWPDVKVTTSLESHSAVLTRRSQRAPDAAAAGKRPPVSRKVGASVGGGLLIVPGGRNALQRLTGVRIEQGNEGTALAVVFDACLRDSTMQARLSSFYEKYNELIGHLQSKGANFGGGRFDLPATGRASSEAVNEVLKFFGIREKNGKRATERKEFDARKFIVDALDGDSQKLERGEATSLRLQDDDFAVPLGMDQWVPWIKDGPKKRPNEHLLAFIKDPRAMRMYVGLASLTDESASWLTSTLIWEKNAKDAPTAVYFAAPYLRFTPQGDLYIPGQKQGEINWQRLMKVESIHLALKALFKRENAEALYLFVALSSVGDVGDTIARSWPYLQLLKKTISDSNIPSGREPFDLVDLFGFIRVEEGKLRFPNVVELWLNPAQKDSDLFLAVLEKLEKEPAGHQIPFVRKIAVLDQIERERPDWVSDAKAVESIVEQVGAGREPQFELALDLQMSRQQLDDYLQQAARIDGISTPALREAALRVFQSAFELLRLVARNGVQDKVRIEDTMAQLLQIDPGSDRFAFEILGALKRGLLQTETPMRGEEVEARFVALLSETASYRLRDQQGEDRAASFYLDASKPANEGITGALGVLTHTRLKAVIDAAVSLEALENSPSNAALTQFKTALEAFVEPEPPPPPKKGKSKQPGVAPTTLKEIAGRLQAPLTPNTLEDLRHQVGPFLGESLLGLVYAYLLQPMGANAQAYASIVRDHQMLGESAWSKAAFDESRRAASGNIGRLGLALADIRARVKSPGDSAPGAKQKDLSALAAVSLISRDLVSGRLATQRALEFVARSIDLGEEVLGLSAAGDQTARAVTDQLDQQLTPRRARKIRLLLEAGEIRKAVASMSLSELYAAGEQYFKMRLSAGAAALADEPGALGAMARVAANVEHSERFAPQLLSEIRQFGITTVTQSGLVRLDLKPPEPYEYASSFEDPRRLLERMQELKLCLARACYRSGYSAQLALSSLLGRAADERILAELLKLAGRMPPDRDWYDTINVIQSFDETVLEEIVKQLTQAGYARLVPILKWNEESQAAK